MDYLQINTNYFKKALKKNNLTMAGLSELLSKADMPTALNTIKSWTRTNDPRRPTIEKVMAIAKILNIDYRELASLPKESDTNIAYVKKLDMLAGAGSAGVFDLQMTSTSTMAIDRNILSKYNINHIRIFECIGDSMEPEFSEGDFVFVDMVDGRDFTKIPAIYIVRVGDIVQIKRVDFLGENKIKLISLNEKYGDYLPHIDGIECEILGKVCGKIQFKKGLTFDNQGIS